MRARKVLIGLCGALVAGKVLVLRAFDRESRSASGTLRPFPITMAPVWIVAVGGALTPLRGR